MGCCEVGLCTVGSGVEWGGVGCSGAVNSR